MNLGRLNLPQRISGVAMLVVILAGFLPWVSFLGVTLIGIRGDGVLTTGFAAAGIVILVWTTGLVGAPRTPGRVSQVALLVLASLVALVGLLDMNGAAAIGLYLTMFAGIAWVIGAVWQLTLSRQAQKERAADPGMEVGHKAEEK